MRPLRLLFLLSLALIAIALFVPLPPTLHEIVLGIGVNIFAVVFIMEMLTYLFPIRLILTRVFRPHSKIRVSMAGLLRLEIGGQFILIDQPRRPGCFGPIGGVYKYFPTAKPALEDLEFVDDREGFEGDQKYERDLRGILPASHVLKFIHWFRDTTDRERDVIIREIREELLAPGLVNDSSSLLALRTRHVRTVQEGPYKVKGCEFLQYRWFDVLEAVDLTDAQRHELEALVKMNSSKIRVATAREIEMNRTRDRRVIGNHAEFLLRKRPVAGHRG